MNLLKIGLLMTFLFVLTNENTLKQLQWKVIHNINLMCSSCFDLSFLYKHSGTFDKNNYSLWVVLSLTLVMVLIVG